MVVVNILLFLVILVGLILVHELGHFWAAQLAGIKVEEFGVGYPPRLAGRRWRGVLYTINWLPFGGFVRLKGELNRDPEKGSFNAAPVWRRAIVVVAGVVMNYLLALVLLTSAFVAGFTPFTVDISQYPGAVPVSQSVIVAGIVPNSPAVDLLQAGDTLLAADGNPLATVEEVQNYTAARRGAEITLTYQRDGTTTTTAVTLAASEAPLGVIIGDYQVTRLPLLSALRAAVADIFGVSKLIVATVGDLLRGLFTAAPINQEIVGPVGIYQVTANAVQAGFGGVVAVVILLSINFALINILPFPALDGGRLVFILLEGLFRRRLVREQLEAAITTVGFILLLMLVILLTYRDILRLI